jgi:hypothetical protein
MKDMERADILFYVNEAKTTIAEIEELVTNGPINNTSAMQIIMQYARNMSAAVDANKDGIKATLNHRLNIPDHEQV